MVAAAAATAAPTLSRSVGPRSTAGRSPGRSPRASPPPTRYVAIVTLAVAARAVSFPTGSGVDWNWPPAPLAVAARALASPSASGVDWNRPPQRSWGRLPLLKLSAKLRRSASCTPPARAWCMVMDIVGIMGIMGSMGHGPHGIMGIMGCVTSCSSALRRAVAICFSSSLILSSDSRTRFAAFSSATR